MRWFHNHPVNHSVHHVISGLTGNLKTVIPGLTRNLLAVLAVSFAVSCGGDEPIDPTPPTPAKDTNAPTITVSKSIVNVIANPVVTISGSTLKIGEESVATWKDDKSTSCTVALTFTPAEGAAKALNSWDKLSEAGKLQIKATDEAGNSATAEVALTREDSQIPAIEVKIADKNVIAGVTVTLQGNQLLFDNEVAATWTDDFTAECKVELTFTPQGSSEARTVASGDKLSEAGTLKLTVADDFDNKSTAEIKLTAVAVYGLENLQGKTLQVDQVVDLLEGIMFAEGLTLGKIEIEENGVRTEIPNPNAFIPQSAGSINIIITLERTDGSTIEVRANGLTVKGIDYQAITLQDIKPEEIFPQITQIEAWDPNIYEYVKDLRVAEGYLMRNMMTEYGTGNYSPEQYQQLLSRANIGLIWEVSDDYQNYEWIWPTPSKVNVTDHGIIVFKNLINLKWEHTKIKNLTNLGEGWGKNLSEYAKEHPNDIFMFSCSAHRKAYSQSEYNQDIFDQNIVDLCDLPNVIIFISWGNTETVNWVDLKIIYNGIYDELNWDWLYRDSSTANSNKNNYPNSNMRIVVWSDPKWNADITNSDGSLFPFGFNNGVTISGHPILPIYRNWRRWGEDFPVNWGYFWSYVTPTVASEVQEMFGLRADVKDANKLLEMIESCTANPDYISLNGNKQALQKYSTANFIKKYCMIADLPSSISTSDISDLNLGWYKGLLFDIPGAEVLVDGQWMAFDAKNKDAILAQNPMTLSWRLNGDLLRKMGYTPGQTVEGQIITVDDQWHGLSLTKPISVLIQ